MRLQFQQQMQRDALLQQQQKERLLQQQQKQSLVVPVSATANDQLCKKCTVAQPKSLIECCY